MAITTNRLVRAKKPTDRCSGTKLAVSTLCVGAALLFSCDHLAQAQSMMSPQTSNAPQAFNSYGQNMALAGPLVMGPGDQLDVNVFNTPELTTRIRIDQAGFIHLPVGGQVKVEGFTAVQAAEAIEKQLRDQQIMLDPHVAVFIFQYATQGVTILGEVRSAGVYPLFGVHSLYDVLSMAGGPTALEGATITITHHRDPSKPEVIQITSPNYSDTQRLTYVDPGDTVFVSKADFVYVVGEIRTPGPIPMPNGQRLSVLTLLAQSGGVNHTAKASKAAIIRKTATGADTIPVNLDKIIKNEAPNIMLEAYDVLVIPRSGLTVFLDYAIPTATAAVSSAVAVSLVPR